MIAVLVGVVAIVAVVDESVVTQVLFVRVVVVVVVVTMAVAIVIALIIMVL